MKTTAQLVPVDELTAAQRDDMFALMDRHYLHVERPTFDADLAEKDWVILVRDEADGRVRGFSTQMLLTADVAGRPVRALFSGDTIISPDARRDLGLFQISGWMCRELMAACPDEELYWFLISKGYKTYRFLPMFFHDFYPRAGAATPPHVAAVLDALAGRKFPGGYDRATGIVRAGPQSCRLRPGVADVTPERLTDPHVRFFLERNPRHAQGDELCCLAPLTLANFTPAAYRAMGPVSPLRPLVLEGV